MLVLTINYKRGEYIALQSFEGEILVKVLEVRGGEIRLGLEAPRQVPIDRRGGEAPRQEYSR